MRMRFVMPGSKNGPGYGSSDCGLTCIKSICVRLYSILRYSYSQRKMSWRKRVPSLVDAGGRWRRHHWLSNQMSLPYMRRFSM